ncbi:MAG TPA: L-fucose isomerase [Planctomycetaceae bacterium]|nr:L-fucose isomerase [Planctomycetaceae bacterium]
MVLPALPNHSDPFRVGIVGFSDGRHRVHQTLEGTILRHGQVLRDVVRADPLLAVVDASEIVHGSKAAQRVAKELRAADVEAAIFNIPVFAFPNFSLIAARVLSLPVLLSSPAEGTLPGLGGILAAHGVLRQVGLKSRKLWGDPRESSELRATLSAFCRAAGAIERMKGSVYGVIGGRSIGMNTGVVDPVEWMRRFGVDVEHIDQLDIVRRAKTADEEEVERAYQWLSDRVGKRSTEGKAAPEHVKTQIKHYMAIRGIIADMGLDFVGIKCHYDLSEYFVTACVSAMLLNDPYDWNGPKASVAMACEADGDGALTMQLLKLLSGYPSLLFDVRSYDFERKLYVCCNCGAQPSWYAARSDSPEENLARVFLEPVISKYGGGGAHFPYVCKAGDITLARLSRVEGAYRLFAARGEFVECPREKMAETCSSWPHGYVKMGIDPRDFIDSFNANHAHVVPGDHLETLTIWGELMGIPVDLVE